MGTTNNQVQDFFHQQYGWPWSRSSGKAAASACKRVALSCPFSVLMRPMAVRRREHFIRVSLHQFHIGVSLDGGTPISHPMIIFSRKNQQLLGKPTIFWGKHPHCTCNLKMDGFQKGISYSRLPCLNFGVSGPFYFWRSATVEWDEIKIPLR